MASDQVVELLRTAYAEEIKESLETDILEELDLAEHLGRRLEQLGSHPPGSAEFTAKQESLQPPADSTNVLSVTEGVLDAEEDAIATYRDQFGTAEDANDSVTEDLAVTILADEVAHRTEFRGFQTEYHTT